MMEGLIRIIDDFQFHLNLSLLSLSVTEKKKLNLKVRFLNERSIYILRQTLTLV